MDDPATRGVVSAGEAARLGMPLPRLALDLVPLARAFARPAISGYRVGAVAVGASGALYYGANLEVAGAALAFTLHAEQSALANAWANGETGLRAIAVSAAPCGHCRQFLYETAGAAAMTLLLESGPRPLAELLPDAFGPADLGVEAALLTPARHGLVLAEGGGPLAEAALAAANASYSPYTRTYAGVALRTAGGEICTGRYAENAAFNPSLSPLPAALSQLVLRGGRFADVEEAVLVENDGPARQSAATEAVLGALGGVRLTVLRAVPA